MYQSTIAGYEVNTEDLDVYPVYERVDLAVSGGSGGGYGGNGVVSLKSPSSSSTGNTSASSASSQSSSNSAVWWAAVPPAAKGKDKSMKSRGIIILAFLLFVTMAFGQTDNTLYLRNFPGNNVVEKMNNAIRACNPNSSIMCIVMIDPTLAAFPEGNDGILSIPSNVAVIDWRAGFPANADSGSLLFPSSSAMFYIPSICTGDPTHDTAIIQTTWASATVNGHVVFPQKQVCAYNGPSLNISIGATYDLNGSTIKFQNSDGGTCSHTAGGLVTYGGSGLTYARITNGVLEADNSSTGCILRVANTTVNFTNKLIVDNIEFNVGSGINSTVGLYMSGFGNGAITNNIFMAGLLQDVLANDTYETNGVSFSRNTYNQLSNATNYQVQLNRFQAVSFKDEVFEVGPRGIRLGSSDGGSGGFTIKNVWMGDPAGGTSEEWIYINGVMGAGSIENSWIYGGSNSSAYGIYVQGVSGYGAGVRVSNNFIQNAGTAVYFGSNASGASVTNNHIYDFTSVGVSINAPNISVQNNQFTSATNNVKAIDNNSTTVAIGPNSYNLASGTTISCESGSSAFITENSTNVPSGCVSLGTNYIQRIGSTAVFPSGYTGSKTAGSCTFTITSGIITAVSGC